MEYEAVIGLEVHAQLKTQTKAFCACAITFGAKPNTQTCPVCLGFPGSLPVLNEKAFEYAIKVAASLDCEVQNFAKFDRKNYYYPDLPKNYQISQYDLPIALRGFLDIEMSSGTKRIGIKRVHLEEDAGKLIHEQEASLVDYNRAGIPLLEIVTEPEISSPLEAYEYLTNLKNILKYIEACDCDMENGSLRCDANISIRKKGIKELGVKAELKNLNSFKAVRDSLTYEIRRQKETLESGQKIIQETRLWDDAGQKTFSMRAKEEAMDYRYFPEPDLTPLVINGQTIERIKSALPELPKARKERFIREYSLSSYDASLLINEKRLADYFEKCIKLLPEPKIICNWLTGPAACELNERNISIENLPIKVEDFVTLIRYTQEAKLSNLAGKEVLKEMFAANKGPEEIIKEKDLVQISDSPQLDAIVDEVIKNNAKSVQDYKNGKINALMFLVGSVMKQSKGKANPKILQEIIKKKIR